MLRHVTLRVEPAGEDGEETLVFASARRRIAIKGRAFREFAADVVPLLDGTFTLDEIQRRVAETFGAPDIANCVALLQQYNLIVDAEKDPPASNAVDPRAPQVNYFTELGDSPARMRDRLRDATVAIVGNGALGAAAAVSLAVTGIGRIRCIDAGLVGPSDPYLAQLFTGADVGRQRAECVRDRLAIIAPDLAVEIIAEPLATDSDFSGALDGVDVAIGCLDHGHASLTYKLNRASLATRVPCCYGEVSAFEGVVGPTVTPFKSPCYLCYQMRLVACAEDPEDAFAELRRLDRAGSDESARRENLSFCSGIVGNMMALEAFKYLIGERSSTVGSIIVLDLVRGGGSRHVVLRKPWCPACYPSERADARGAPS